MLSAQITKNNMEGPTKEIILSPKLQRWINTHAEPFKGSEDLTMDPYKAARMQYRDIAENHLRRGESEKQVLDFLKAANSETS